MNYTINESIVKTIMKKMLLAVAMMFLVQGIIGVSFASPTEIEVVKKALKGIIKAEPDSVKLTPADGLYEIAYGSKIVYMTKDGNYLIEGDVFDVKKGINLTEGIRQAGRKKAIDSIDMNNVIVFSPKDKKAKHVVTAFTDIDCGYCRKLHKEMKKYNDLGIK